MTTKKKTIPKLTPEQIAGLPAFRDKWLGHGLCTDKIDPEVATKAVKALYRVAGQPEPAVLMFESPRACLLARAMYMQTKADPSINDGMYITSAKLRWAIRSMGGLKNQSMFQGTWFIGGQDAYWMSFYEMGRQIGVEYDDKVAAHFEAYKGYALNCGWMYAYAGVAFVSDRPRTISLDTSQRLHNATGRALEYRDGWGVSAWHNVRIPDWFIDEPKRITIQAIRDEPNQELKRVLAEIMGPERRLREGKAKLLSQDECGKLWRSRIGDEDWLEVEVINGSPEPDGTVRHYFLDVTGAAERLGWPIVTARAAVAATYGLRPEEYRVTVRT